MNSIDALESIFADALSLQPPQRAAFLDNACRGDIALRRHVDRMLAAHADAGSFLEAPPSAIAGHGPIALHQAPTERPGDRIGPYKLLEQIGEGGMGVVYMAQQTQPVKRRVALKVIKPGMDSRQVVARFEAERQALALMEHPNIARVLDAGATDGGRPYFVMELVRGIAITDYCDREKLDTRQRLELFVDVCRAVQHAHQKAIIHRDLKPSNVLITSHDGEPVVKVIDFGVAKALNQELTERTLFTQFSQMVGTPLYMSPEQAELNGLDIDTRSDIYSLGVLLYELLTGTTPFDKATLSAAGFDEMRRIIREEEPPRPSARVSTLQAPESSTISERRSSDPRRISIALRGELDWIVMKALEKDRNRRYESAGALALDIKRYLANEPIIARPASVGYRFRKWVCRKPAAAIVTAVVTLAVIAALLGGWYHDHHLASANSALDAANNDLNAANQQLNLALADARRLEAEAVERERQVRLQTYARDMRFAFNALRYEGLGPTFRYLERYQPDKEQPDQQQSDLRSFEWHWLKGLFPTAEQTLAGHSAPLIAADVSPNERWIASGDKVGDIKIWELASGREVKTLHYADAEITSVAFSPDGQTLATAGVDRTIRLFQVSDWSEQATLRSHELTVTSIAWSPDGQQLASGGRDHTLRIWNVANPHNPQTLPAFKDVVRCVAWSPSGETLAAAIREDALYLLNTKTWKASLIQSDDGDHGALALAFDQSGTLLASAGYGNRLYLHDVASHKQLADVETPSSIQALAFSADQRKLFVGLRSGELFVCELHSNGRGVGLAQCLQLGQEVLRSVKASRSGHWLVTAHEQSSAIHTYSTSQFHAPREVYRYDSMFLAISAREDLACTLNSAGAPQLVSFPPGKVFGLLEKARQGRIRSAKFFPVGQRLLILDGDALRLYDTSTRQHLGDFEPSGKEPYYLTISPQGRYVAATVFQAGHWRLCVWEASTRRRVCYLPGPQVGFRTRMAFSPDEQILAMASPIRDGGSVLLWNLATQTKLAEISETAIADLEFSPDGKWLALARGWEVLLWNVADRSLTTLPGHMAPITDLTFSPIGSPLATVDSAGTARLWHVPTYQEIGILSSQAIPASIDFRSPYQLINYADAQPTKPAEPFDIRVFEVAGRDGSDAGRAKAEHELTTK